MKILYLSCHSILEVDEVKLLHELGHEVFSPGAYVEPDNPGDDSLRPGIDGLTYDPDILEQFHKIGSQHPGDDAKDFLTKEFVSNFDCVIVMHLPRWIGRNWEALKGTRVIWRTIGQSVAQTEASLKGARSGIQIVRYSPKERNIPGFIGEDALIRFYKDPADYGNWTGDQERVITFGQHMKRRGQACSFPMFEEATRPFNRHLFGPGNENTGDWCTGKVPFSQLQEEMRTNRAYFYTGTHPASYTLNFMEAWMTGIPIVALGPEHGNANYFANHPLYEVHELIDHGVNGFVRDDIDGLQGCVEYMLTDHRAAKEIGEAGRKKAIKIFGKNVIKEQWKEFLGE